MVSVIVKIQRPLSGDMSQAFVYNESRTIEMFVPMLQVIELFGDKLKVYWEATLVGTELQLIKEVEVHNW